MIHVTNPEFADWEIELYEIAPHSEGEGNAVFVLNDGSKIMVHNVNVDSISPVAVNSNVIAVEFFKHDAVVHIPFVRYWTIEYRF